jgi:hypothetical protein
MVDTNQEHHEEANRDDATTNSKWLVSRAVRISFGFSWSRLCAEGYSWSRACNKWYLTN